MQIYLDHLTKENEDLKLRLEDTKITAVQNKKMLKEFIENISNKDQIVEKLQCTIENLQERVNSQEEFIKKSITLKTTKSSTNILTDRSKAINNGDISARRKNDEVNEKNLLQ